jgi:hypothetical protein
MAARLKVIEFVELGIGDVSALPQGLQDRGLAAHERN